MTTITRFQFPIDPLQAAIIAVVIGWLLGQILLCAME